MPRITNQPLEDDALRLFGETLQRLRRRKQWSQELLADELGVDRSYVSSLERGLRNPTLKTLVALCALFAVDLRFAGASLVANGAKAKRSTK